MAKFKEGDEVYHLGMNAKGVVTGVGADDTVRVHYDQTRDLGSIVGVYDRRWFEIYPRELIPRPRGGANTTT